MNCLAADGLKLRGVSSGVLLRPALAHREHRLAAPHARVFPWNFANLRFCRCWITPGAAHHSSIGIDSSCSGAGEEAAGVGGTTGCIFRAGTKIQRRFWRHANWRKRSGRSSGLVGAGRQQEQGRGVVHELGVGLFRITVAGAAP